MTISPIGLYRSVARLSDPESAAGARAATGGQSFKDTLAEFAKHAAQTVQGGEAAVQGGLAGTTDTHQVVAAMTQAELTIQATVAVRDKMMQAYQEIMRMPV